MTLLGVLLVGLVLVVGSGSAGRWLCRPDPDAADQDEVDALVDAWTRAIEGAGFVRRVDTVSGPTIVAPKVTFVVLGPPAVLTVRLEPGQTVGDLRALAGRLAPHLGSGSLRVEPVGHGLYARVTLLDEDPLDAVVPAPRACADGRVLLGRLDNGDDLEVDPRVEGHVVVQGVTGSGKSVFTYGLLVQLHAAEDVVIAGCDPTGLLFRPFAGTRHAPWQASGLADLDVHETVLQRLVDEMDARVAGLPDDRDSIDVSAVRPLLVVIVEELAGLLRAFDAASKDQGRRVRALIARLLAEGRKAGVRVVLLVQRAEAAVVGAFERAMCSSRLSFRVDTRASVELLHPGADQALADGHSTAPAGVALVSIPGRPLLRLRAPYVGGYGEYVALVRGQG